jgi:hypothetical protein
VERSNQFIARTVVRQRIPEHRALVAGRRSPRQSVRSAVSSTSGSHPVLITKCYETVRLILFMDNTIIDFVSELEFIASINEFKDCLMNQDKHQQNPEALWFNIDIPKGHGLRAGDKVRIIIQRI